MKSSSHVDNFANPAQGRTSGPDVRDFSWLNRRTAYFIVIAVILGIYSYPALRTAVATRSLRLPAVSAPDLGLYLSLSKLEKSRDGMTLNPFYRIPVPYPVGYLKFRSGPALFGLLNVMFGGRIWFSLFMWNLLWWFFLCLAGIWLFERWLPRPTTELVLAGVSLLMLFSVDEVSRFIMAWIHLAPAWLAGGLPFIRPFAPQVIMPLLLCYLGLQMRALSGKNLAAWGMMAVLQFVAFTFFPYGTLMMAGTTAVAASWYIFARNRESAWRVVLGFLLVCALADMAFALYGSAGFRYGFPDQTSLIKFEPSLAIKAIGKLWLLTGILVIAIATSRKLPPEVKWPLAGLGLSTILFVLGDAVVSERLFLLNIHIGYFYQPAVVVLLTFVVSAYTPGRVQSLRLTRIISLAVVGLCFVYGWFMAEGNYRGNLTHNVRQADLASWFGRGEVSSRDLVITQYEGTQCDACEWIPLLSDAETLYCRNSQLALTAEQNRDMQRLREVLYLYFVGKDHQWLESATEFERYGLYGEVSSFHRPEERTARIIALRHEMLPFFERIENGDPSMHDFFRRFRRVWIIQYRQNPAFVDTRLASYLNFKEQQTSGRLLITSLEPK